MNNFEILVSRMQHQKGASRHEIDEASRQLAFTFPSDYVDFLSFTNGATGEIGTNYIQIWSLEDLLKAHRDLQVEDYAPGLVPFGCDGGNEIYAFDGRTDEALVVQVPMIGMSLEQVWLRGRTFTEFLMKQAAS